MDSDGQLPHQGPRAGGVLLFLLFSIQNASALLCVPPHCLERGSLVEGMATKEPKERHSECIQSDGLN